MRDEKFYQHNFFDSCKWRKIWIVRSFERSEIRLGPSKRTIFFSRIEMINFFIQNCGPRPQGPRYPQPPAASTGDPTENASCDIMRDAQYISGYKCKAPCQADLEQTVEINCNCHTSMGPLQFIKQCEWEFVDGKRCPKLKVKKPRICKFANKAF